MTYDAARLLASQAERLDGERDGLPALFAFTDPVRTPDLLNLAKALPPGAGLVLRSFGRAEIEAQAFELSAIAHERGLILLTAADPDLARRCGAHGVHWPQARLAQGARARHGGLITASAHCPAAARRAAGLADAVFVSTAFASRSPSAKRPLGPFRLAAYTARCPKPVYALGGINTKSINRLIGLGLAGAAAIDGLMCEPA